MADLDSWQKKCVGLSCFCNAFGFWPCSNVFNSKPQGLGAGAGRAGGGGAASSPGSDPATPGYTRMTDTSSAGDAEAATQADEGAPSNPQ